MKQVARVLSTYSADVMGVCSALYELGGMTIIYDPSGCNSTYTTHDEPRWYDMESMVFLCPLTEMDAVMGNDAKLIDDTIKAANELKPKFISLVGAVIPMLAGTDFKGIARVIESRTGIPTIGFKTNGMHSYLTGANMAFEKVAERFCKQDIVKNNSDKTRINLLGVTPLDFSITGTVEKIKEIFDDNDIEITSTFAMGSTFEEIESAGNADVNVVVSSCGIGVATKLKEMFGIPYVCGVPMGEKFAGALIEGVKSKNADAYSILEGQYDNYDSAKTIIIGEEIMSKSMAKMLEYDFDMKDIGIITPFEETNTIFHEDTIEKVIKNAKFVIADPLYRRILPKNSDIRFIELPHEAYSGRIYRSQIPVMAGKEFLEWFTKKA